MYRACEATSEYFTMTNLDLLCISVVFFVYLKGYVQCQTTDLVGPSADSCDTYKCPENSKCVDDFGFIYCDCPIGKTGVDCTLEDPCMERTTNCSAGSTCFGDCGPNIVCEGATGYAHCRGCAVGWTGMQCELDVDECADATNPCLHDGTCTNTRGGFQCTCMAGWTGEICDCKKGTECDLEESKTGETKGGTETQHVYSTTLLLASLLTYAIWTV